MVVSYCLYPQRISFGKRGGIVKPSAKKLDPLGFFYSHTQHPHEAFCFKQALETEKGAEIAMLYYLRKVQVSLFPEVWEICFLLLPVQRALDNIAGNIDFIVGAR